MMKPTNPNPYILASRVKVVGKLLVIYESGKDKNNTYFPLTPEIVTSTGIDIHTDLAYLMFHKNGKNLTYQFEKSVSLKELRTSIEQALTN